MCGQTMPMWKLILLLWTFVLILVVFSFLLLFFSLRFGQISPLAFFRWLAATSDRNAESCNRIPNNYCLPKLLSIAPHFWLSKPLAGWGRNWNRYLLTMFTWNCRDSTPLSATPRAPKTTKMRTKVRNKKINSQIKNLISKGFSIKTKDAYVWELIFIYCGLLSTCWYFFFFFFFVCVVSSFTTFRPNFTSGLQVIYRDLG